MRKSLLVVAVTLAVLAGMIGATVPASASDIRLGKTTSPLLPNTYRVGDTITYILNISNPSDNPATNTLTQIKDILPGSQELILNNGDVVLSPGESVSYTVFYTVQAAHVETGGGGEKIVRNRLEVLGNDSLGDAIEGSVNKTSTIIFPSINLEKLVNGQDADSPVGPMVLAGSTVTFDFIVTNTGDASLSNMVVSDNVLGAIGTIPSLAPGASQTLTITATALAGQHTNTGTATGTPPVGSDVSDTDPGNYFGAVPGIDLEKTAAFTSGDGSAVGDNVTYTFTVTNTGNVLLDPVSVIDSVFGAIGLGATSLAPGDNTTGYYILTVTPELLDAGSHYNEATATGTPPIGPVVTDTDDETVRFTPHKPVIQATKTGPAAARVGNMVTFTITVSHAPASDGYPVTIMHVTDNICGPAIYVSGDDGDNLLESGETWTYTCSYTVPAGCPDPLLNTVIATGSFDGREISASADHSMDIREQILIGTEVYEIDRFSLVMSWIRDIVMSAVARW